MNVFELIAQLSALVEEYRLDGRDPSSLVIFMNHGGDLAMVTSAAFETASVMGEDVDCIALEDEQS